MLGWMGRTALELIGQGGLGHSFDPLVEETKDKFSEAMKIGEGGYGPVYKGKLDHTAVAIKVLRPDAAQGRKQFQQEVSAF